MELAKDPETERCRDLFDRIYKYAEEYRLDPMETIRDMEVVTKAIKLMCNGK